MISAKLAVVFSSKMMNHLSLRQSILMRPVTTLSHHTPLPSHTTAKRPLSPHLSIYRPQLTWLMSIAHRFTGAALSTGVYTAAIVYSIYQPQNAAYLISSFIINEVPLGVVVLAKLGIGATFVYHCLNGIRHLVR